MAVKQTKDRLRATFTVTVTGPSGSPGRQLDSAKQYRAEGRDKEDAADIVAVLQESAREAGVTLEFTAKFVKVEEVK